MNSDNNFGINFVASEIKSPKFRFFYSFFVFVFIWNLIWLGYIGGHPVAEPNLTFGQIATCIYFLFFLVFVPLCVVLENISRIQNIKIKGIQFS